VLGPLITIIFGGIGFWQVHRGKVSLQGQVTRLQSDIQMVTAIVAPQLLQRLGTVVTSAISLPAKDVAVAANQAREIIRTLRKDKFPVQRNEIIEAASATSALAKAHPDVPQVWQTAAELVSYRSELSQITLPKDLPNCLYTIVPGNNFDRITTPSGQKVDVPGFSSYQSSGGWMSHVMLANCVLYLDAQGFEDTPVGKFFAEVRKQHPNTSLFSLVLSNARIVYSGGTILPVTEVQFTNCIFDFKPSSITPASRGRALTDQLLTANLDTGTVQLPAYD
jgi:hypothetical protein